MKDIFVQHVEIYAHLSTITGKPKYSQSDFFRMSIWEDHSAATGFSVSVFMVSLITLSFSMLGISPSFFS